MSQARVVAEIQNPTDPEPEALMSQPSIPVPRHPPGGRSEREGDDGGSSTEDESINCAIFQLQLDFSSDVDPTLRAQKVMEVKASAWEESVSKILRSCLKLSTRRPRQFQP